MLRLNEITKEYAVAGGTVPALNGVSVNFRKNEFVSILGPSGCGKTTLLNIIGGLDEYTDGDLVINGRSTKDYGDRDWDVYRNHRIGFIFQSYNLIPHQTVLGNVELALTIAGVSKAERKERAEAALIKVGLGDHLHKRPNQLSGGQCQRVAIARALVNDPEILLADEPTGALDTKTSVQIMDLMKEIAGERLVIMVTHNPELAEQYSTRIIRLLDGRVVDDTMPFGEEEERAECEETKRREEIEREENERAAAEGKRVKPAKEKAKMGFMTALALSARNLIAKKGRTIMVGIAGSIGIIGVAIVLAFSSGISGYIYSMETDMLSGYPVSVSQSAIDYTQLLNMTMSMGDGDKSWHERDKIYINSVVETMTELSSTTVSNDITAEYISFVERMPKDYYRTIKYNYGINVANNIYTDFVYDEGIENDTVSVTGVRAVYSDVLREIETYRQYAGMIGNIATFSEIPDSREYILGQYDMIAGEYPAADDKNGLVLVLTGDDEINDVTLAQLGYVSAREFLNYAFELAGNEDLYDPNKPHMSETFDYATFVGGNAKSFTWYPNSVVYEMHEGDGTSLNPDSFTYHTYANDFTEEEKESGVELRVRCILKPKDDVQFGSLSSGLYYTKALTDHIRGIELNEETQSPIVKKGLESTEEDRFVGNIKYDYHYYSDEIDEDTGEVTRNVRKDKNSQNFGTSAQAGMAVSGLSIITSMYTREEFEQAIDMALNMQTDDAAKVQFLKNTFIGLLYGSSDKVVYLSELGGEELPSRMSFYTEEFENKDKITAYLDTWNDPWNLYVYPFADGQTAVRNADGSPVWAGDRQVKVTDADGNESVVTVEMTDGENAAPRTDEARKVQYTDTIGAIMTMVGTLITMVTFGLIAFTSIALVVSTVMIGIITYVSVVERIKEIGVIRAMGGSKRDVKNLFNAETFIIGLLAGLIGIVATYLLSLIANLIVGGLFGIYTIASLPVWQAAIMVALSVCLTLISGLIPASAAAKKDPVVALRTE